jgi:hypothetical protein
MLKELNILSEVKGSDQFGDVVRYIEDAARAVLDLSYEYHGVFDYAEDQAELCIIPLLPVGYITEIAKSIISREVRNYDL